MLELRKQIAKACRSHMAGMVVALGLVMPIWSIADESNIKTIDQTFHAQRLEVDGFAGQLSVDVEKRSDLAVQIRGAGEDMGGVAMSVQDGTLRIKDRRGAIRGTSVVSVGNVTTVVSGGGSATVNIGGREFGGGAARQPVEINVRIPAGAPLDLRGLVGNCRIGDLRGPVKLTLSSGHCTLGEITLGELRVEGSGDIAVQQVDGDLHVAVSGSGDIRVRGGKVNRLEASLSGSGQIDLGVHAQQAVLTLVGAGNIHVAEVRERPRMTKTGAGDIVVGNW